MSVNTAHGAFKVDGVHTEVLVTDYGNRVMVVVTQIGKLGTVYYAADPGPGGVFEGDLPPEVRTLIGRYDDETLEAAARRLAQIVQSRGVNKCVSQPGTHRPHLPPTLHTKPVPRPVVVPAAPRRNPLRRAPARRTRPRTHPHTKDKDATHPGAHTRYSRISNQLRPVLVSLGTEPNLPMGTLRGVVRAAGDFTTEALGLASPQPGGQAQ